MANSDWQLLGLLLLVGVVIWVGMRFIRRAPGLFSKANLSKTITTTGVIALLLILVIAVCILLLRSGI